MSKFSSLFSNQRSPRMKILAAILAGMAMFLGVPETDLWWLGFVGWIPWLWAIDGATFRKAFILGLLTGTVAIFVGFYWMTELLVRFGGFGLPFAIAIHALFALSQGLQWALPALLIVRCTHRRPELLWLFAPVAWTAVEILLPNVFPTYMALMWCWKPLWIQHADLGGAAFVGTTMVLINAAAYQTLRFWFAHRRWHRPSLIALIATLIAIPSYGAIRMAQTDHRVQNSDNLAIAVVQGNFGILSYSDPNLKHRLLAELQRETARLQQQGAQMALWGETAYPYPFRFFRDSTQDLPSHDPRRIRQGFDIPIIVGLVTSDREDKNPYPWNSAWAMDSLGRLGDRFDKNYPLIFGEYVPLVDPEWYLQQVPSASYINRGDGPGVLNAAGYRFGPLICYEDLLSEFNRATIQNGVHALVNLTNDSWFGKNREQAEHLGLALFRAIEHRRPLLRAVNAGISAYIDPAGRVVQKLAATDSDKEGYRGAQGFVAQVPMIDPEYRTIFSQLGSTYVIVLLLLLGYWSMSTPTARNQQPRSN